MKIVLSGGGTLGPVIPLLAVREAVLKKYPDAQFVWVGTKNGPEREIIQKVGLPFYAIGAGKWRRYFSLWNFLDLFKITLGFFQSLWFIWQQKPDLLISCGGFVSVPLHVAGWLLHVPAWVHQQDVELGFANKLMFPFAKKITTALRETAERLPDRKTEWLGNPSRDLSLPGTGPDSRVSLHEAYQKFGIPVDAPVIFALGGGTGSASINRIVLDAIPHWPATWHIIHLVGKERPKELQERAAKAFPNYHVFEFFTDEMKQAYAIATVVVARAGFGTLTELAALSKPAVILPMFDTHQEQNAKLFADHGGIIMLQKGTNSGLRLAKIIEELVLIPEKRQALGDRLHQLLPRAKPEKIVEIMEELVRG